MPTIVHGFDWPDRLVVGTIGRPGERSFYIQARDGRRVVSVAIEKEQSAVLADKIDELLDEVATVEDNRFSVPDAAPTELRDGEPLDQPVEPEFRAGALSLGFDPATAQVVSDAWKSVGLIAPVGSKVRPQEINAGHTEPASARGVVPTWLKFENGTPKVEI